MLDLRVLLPFGQGTDVTQQVAIDQKMIELDGTENKAKLGANGILAVSMAACRVSNMQPVLLQSQLLQPP